MIDDYLINGKLYLKDQVIIECCKTDGLIYDSEHEWITIHDLLSVVYCDENELIFEHGGQKWAYWCVTSLFLESSCLSKSDIRNNKIGNILQ